MFMPPNTTEQSVPIMLYLTHMLRANFLVSNESRDAAWPKEELHGMAHRETLVAAGVHFQNKKPPPYGGARRNATPA